MVKQKDKKIEQAIAHIRLRRARTLIISGRIAVYADRRLGSIRGTTAVVRKITWLHLMINQDQVRISMLVLARLQRKQTATVEVLQCSGETFVGSILTPVQDCFYILTTPMKYDDTRVKQYGHPLL